MIGSEAVQTSAANTPAYFALFGLTREPFSLSVEDDMFYSEAEGGERLNLSRSQRLNLLLHLAPYSDALLVTGEAGIGKTTLLHQFLARVEPTWRICAVSASPVVTNEVITQCLVREFVKEEGISPDRSNQIESLRQHIQALRESSLSPILVIDDAHELSKDVLGFLLRLVQTNKNGGKLLSVIMFSEADIEKNLGSAELAPLRNLISHSFELTPFNEEDTATYIKHRLAIAGLTGDSPFTPAVVKVIYGTSHGIPSKINELSQVVLNNSATADLPPDTIDTAPKVDLFKRYGLVGAITILLVMVLAFQDHINSLFTTNKSGNHVATVTTQNQTESGSGDMTAQPLQANKDESGSNLASENAPSPKSQDIAQESVGMVARDTTADSQGTQQADTATGTEGRSVKESQNVIDGRDEREVATVEVEGTGKEKQVTTVMNTTGDSSQETQAPLPEPVMQEKPVSALTPIDSGPAAAKPSSSKPITTLPDVSTPSETKQMAVKPAGTVHHEGWLMQQDPHSYTLQLLAIPEEAIVKRYIKDHRLQDQAAYFSTYKNGVERIAVVYGIYPTRAEADLAVTQIKRRITNVQPWIRSIKSVQESINSKSVASSPAEVKPSTSIEVVSKPDVSSPSESKQVAVKPADTLHHEEWLMQQDPHSYTLQLMAIREEAIIKRYIKNHKLQDQAAYFSTYNNGVELLAVVYGVYPTRKDAELAVTQIKRRITGVQPWIRSIKSVQDAVTASQAE